MEHENRLYGIRISVLEEVIGKSPFSLTDKELREVIERNNLLEQAKKEFNEDGSIKK